MSPYPFVVVDFLLYKERNAVSSLPRGNVNTTYGWLSSHCNSASCGKESGGLLPLCNAAASRRTPIAAVRGLQLLQLATVGFFEKLDQHQTGESVDLDDKRQVACDRRLTKELTSTTPLVNRTQHNDFASHFSRVA
jgi:hypothetical protein